ncbi:testis-specific serine/threonine-protein kinase 3-like isoform X2 [Onthophagus taurus]|uniref:testis-specific serine/threonine-protein kinase 3-like isoform X2 n=1 Tax=Onthophagus taurus TaxID=166361 RepID=UPI000C20420A|nr:testis-specific serine/threonine-protein kinase 3-like isoform X2 [Onthophagus taurus]
MPSPKSSVHQHTSNAPTGQTVEHKEKKTVLENHGYYLGKTIGAGSYATVRLAHSDIHGGDVAVKIVSKYTAPEDYLKKFLPREIEVVKGLKHPNLIRFLQAIETTHRVYICMEYAANGSLLDIIRRDTYIDETRARNWFRQLVDAIDYCHERGVVHRDIKCENLLMDDGFNIKVSDFGFARGHLKNSSGQNVLSETFCGSYAYASPEILKGVPYHPQFSDVWSMGVVLYAMAFGRLPFDDTNYSLLLKQVSNKVTFPREPKVTTSCRTLISKILAPLKVRLRVSGIRNDPWYNYVGDKAGSSKDHATDPKKITSANRGMKDNETLAKDLTRLITKEQQIELQGNVQKLKQKRHSTDDQQYSVQEKQSRDKNKKK